MPRTKKRTGDKPLPANKQKGKKVCTCCHKEKNLIDYYLSYSPMYSLDQRVPICKECCKTSVLNEDGTINFPKLKILLRSIDKPLYYDLLQSSEDSVRNENGYLNDEEIQYRGKEIIQKYFTLIVMRQDRARNYSDSEIDNFIHHNNNRTNDEKRKILAKYRPMFESKKAKEEIKIEEDLQKEKEKQELKIKTDASDFKVSNEIISLFGDGYSKLEYKKMYEKYEKLKINYVLQTNIHQEALATYVRFKVKEEDATARGDVDEAKKWYDAAQNAAEKARLTPRQLSKEDLQGGITNFSDIFSAVEGAKERVKIFPEFKYQPKDAADFIIWCYINYERRLNNMPEVEYKDIYAFYDEKKREYVEMYGDPYGIFNEDTTKSNRDTIEKFITVPKEFEDEND